MDTPMMTAAELATLPAAELIALDKALEAKIDTLEGDAFIYALMVGQVLSERGLYVEPPPAPAPVVPVPARPVFVAPLVSDRCYDIDAAAAAGYIG